MVTPAQNLHPCMCLGIRMSTWASDSSWNEGLYLKWAHSKFSVIVFCVLWYTLTVCAIHITPHVHFIKLHDSWVIVAKDFYCSLKNKTCLRESRGTAQGNSNWTLYFEILCGAVWSNWANTHRAQTQYPAKAFFHTLSLYNHKGLCILQNFLC